jgi:AcrR family transcriptional regulator
MRVKTDAMRQAIIAAAWEVFKENGFDRTTMSQISARLGGSKATLYGYFKSKEVLFGEAMEQALRERFEQAFDRFEAKGDLGERLLRFAHAYMAMRLAPDMIGAYRALTSEAERSDFGETLRRELIVARWNKVAAVIEAEMKAGRLLKADPYLAVMHFRGLIEADIVERKLHGDHSITRSEVDKAVEAGVSAFLRAYAA